MKYGSADLDTFLSDFGIEIRFNGKKGLGILDTPDEIFIDGQVQSTVYQIIFKTSDFDFSFDDIVDVDGVDYKIKEVVKMDDGSLSKAFLNKI